MLIKPLNRFRAKISGKVTLRTVLIVPFVLQTFAAVGLVGYLSFRNGQKAVNDLANQLQSEISDRIEQEVQQYLDTPHKINQTLTAAINLDLLDVKNRKALELYLWRHLKIFDSIHAIFFGYQEGGITVARRHEGRLFIDETKGLVNGDYYIYTTDNQGNRQELFQFGNPYDARTDSCIIRVT
ncbi:MAG: hypothetical protein F6K14_31730, partial [Symploca sp. SIO2C1]|nr:hypothetical protein [Symploca sp. SIO2C1]